MTSAQQNALESKTDQRRTGFTFRSRLVHGGKENLMAGASRQKRGAVPTSRSAGEFGIEFVALGPRIEPSALVGTPKVAIDQLRLLLRRIGIWRLTV
jgi:hypothetical protein